MKEAGKGRREEGRKGGCEGGDKRKDEAGGERGKVEIASRVRKKIAHKRFLLIARYTNTRLRLQADLLEMI